MMKIHLIEMSDRLLGAMSSKASRKAYEHLTKMGVNVRTQEAVKDYDGRTVQTSREEELCAHHLIWTAGIEASFPEGLSHCSVTKGNRLQVDDGLKVKGMKRVYAIGDVAALCSDSYPNGHPQLAQPAIQQGKYLARSFEAMKKGKSLKPFEYRDKGVMATIGKRRAVADIGRLKFDGYLAWLLWSLIHLFQISGFRNRFLVAMNWAWSYFGYEKGDRLIIRKYRKEEGEGFSGR